MLYFVQKVWCSGHGHVVDDDDVYSSGCFAALMPPGLCTSVGDSIATPVYSGNITENSRSIHFAGTELATSWPGYFEGAIQSGYRAAEEIVHA